MLILLPSGILADSPTGTRRTTRSLLRRFLSSSVLVVLSELDLATSSGMLLRSPDGQVSLDYPGSCHQANRRDGRTSDKEKVHVPFGVGSRFVQEVGPGQEEEGRQEYPKGAIFSH